MNAEQERFVKEYLKEMLEDSAALFAGAGLSAGAGYLDWRGLLRPIAEELDLDISKETDLVLLAQYYSNEHAGNRGRLSQLLIEEVGVERTPTPNHRLLARLPISTYWTTNYDRLIETALKDAGKIVDVKYSVPQLATTRPRRDAIVYKMHGDIELPYEAVLIKDDYEKYHLKHGAFVNALAGDLVSKTFLFVGFSFTDPNLDYVLSRIRITFEQHQRRHYCIFKRRTKLSGESEAEFLHAHTKQQLAIGDLKRFNIRTLLVDEYAEITQILEALERRYRRRTIFISGSAHEYGSWTEAQTTTFLRELSRALVQRGYRIATGVGLGVGDAVVTGALEEIYRARTGHIEDSLLMRPFPRASSDPEVRKKLWEDYRQELISSAGIALILLGNRLVEGAVAPADGVRREFEIAIDHGLSVLPIGGSGYVARELWELIMSRFADYFPDADAAVLPAFEKVGAEVDDPIMLMQPILDLIAAVAKE